MVLAVSISVACDAVAAEPLAVIVYPGDYVDRLAAATAAWGS